MVNIAARWFGVAALSAVAAGAALAVEPVDQAWPTDAGPSPSEPSGPRSCMTHDGADDKLRTQFGEKVLGRGVSSDGTLVEIFLAPSGTFTVIKTTPKGLSCVVDFGEGWQTLHQLQEVGLTPDDLAPQHRAEIPH